MPFVSTTPMGVVDTAAFIREVGKIVRAEKEGTLLLRLLHC
jgi:hypothetical protein